MPDYILEHLKKTDCVTKIILFKKKNNRCLPGLSNTLYLQTHGYTLGFIYLTMYVYSCPSNIFKI